jgi:hypothetical protein
MLDSGTGLEITELTRVISPLGKRTWQATGQSAVAESDLLAITAIDKSPDGGE